jgi:leucyl-tRNA synthetase
MVLSPEHELVNRIVTKEQEADVLKYQEASRRKSDLERTELSKEKTGVFTGAYAINPVNNVEIPIWIADYVLSSYGTGAIMAVPAHDERDFEFAKKFKLPIICVVMPDEKLVSETVIDKDGNPKKIGEYVVSYDPQKENRKDGIMRLLQKVKKGELPHLGDGIMVNSDFLNGLETVEAMQAMIHWLEDKGIGKAAKQYKLRDWVFSRQHYWGEPIPIVFCDKCEEVAVPYDQLPVKLPMVKKYEPTDTGESPLAAIADWVNTKCPKCGGPARRETDTMPNWAGSSWYFLRYIDPKNTEEFANFEKLKYWLPVDLYNGGMEHTTLHLLYSRFWHKFLYDLGVVPTAEPYQRRVSHGMILAEGGVKMSKSKGNVINPDEVVAEYGADVLRAYEMFMGPYDQPVAWDTNGMKGVRRFLEKIWNFEKFIEKDDVKLETLLNKTIKKVTDDIEQMRFNTAVSAMMIFMNEAEKVGLVKDSFKKFLQILSPIMPHLTEEVWEKLGEKNSIHVSVWPKFDEALIQDEKVTIAIQINGKVRDTIEVARGLNETEIKALVMAREKVQKNLEGKELKKFIFIKDKLVSLVV